MLTLEPFTPRHSLFLSAPDAAARLGITTEDIYVARHHMKNRPEAKRHWDRFCRGDGSRGSMLIDVGYLLEYRERADAIRVRAQELYWEICGSGLSPNALAAWLSVRDAGSQASWVAFLTSDLWSYVPRPPLYLRISGKQLRFIRLAEALLEETKETA